MTFCPECVKKILNQNKNVKMNTKTEKPLAKRNKLQKRLKHPAISILDTIANIFFIPFAVSLIITIISATISYFTDQQLYQNIWDISRTFAWIFLVIYVASSSISDRLKRHIRKKLIKAGILAQARILEVNNLDYDPNDMIRTAELILEVYSKADDPYHAKSIINVCLSDVSLIFFPGKTVQVLIDPEDASHVEVKHKLLV